MPQEFDPNQPFEVVDGGASPAVASFDPSKPFDVVPSQPAFKPVSVPENFFDNTPAAEPETQSGFDVPRRSVPEPNVEELVNQYPGSDTPEGKQQSSRLKKIITTHPNREEGTLGQITSAIGAPIAVLGKEAAGIGADVTQSIAKPGESAFQKGGIFRNFVAAASDVPEKPLPIEQDLANENGIGAAIKRGLLGLGKLAPQLAAAELTGGTALGTAGVFGATTYAETKDPEAALTSAGLGLVFPVVDEAAGALASKYTAKLIQSGKIGNAGAKVIEGGVKNAAMQATMQAMAVPQYAANPEKWKEILAENFVQGLAFGLKDVVGAAKKSQLSLGEQSVRNDLHEYLNKVSDGMLEIIGKGNESSAATSETGVEAPPAVEENKAGGAATPAPAIEAVPAAPVAPKLQPGESLVTIKRPDGTTYQAVNDPSKVWEGAGPNGEDVPQIGTIMPDGRTSHGMLPDGHEIVSTPTPPETGEVSPPTSEVPANEAPKGGLKTEAVTENSPPVTLTPEQTAKLSENMRVANDLAPADLQAMDGHLKLVLGPDAPTFKQLVDSGVIKTTPLENGKTRVEMAENPPTKPVEAPAEQPPQPASQPEIAPAAAQSEAPPAKTEAGNTLLAKMDFGPGAKGTTAKAGIPFVEAGFLPDFATKRVALMKALAKGAIVDNKSRSNTNRVVFLKDNKTGDVVVLGGAWEAAGGHKFVRPEKGTTGQDAIDILKTPLDPKNEDAGPRYTLLASGRLAQPEKNYRQRISLTDYQSISDAGKQFVADEVRNLESAHEGQSEAQQISAEDLGHREDVQTVAGSELAGPARSRVKQRAEGTIDAPTSAKLHKLIGEPKWDSPEEAAEMVVNAVEALHPKEAENLFRRFMDKHVNETDDDLLEGWKAALQHIIDVYEKHPDNPNDQLAALQSVSKQPGVETAVRAVNESGGNPDGKTAEVPGAAVNGGTDARETATAVSEATGRSVLPEKPAEGTGAGSVLPAESAAEAPADGVTVPSARASKVVKITPLKSDAKFDRLSSDKKVRQLGLKTSQSARELLSTIGEHIGFTDDEWALVDKLNKFVGDTEVRLVSSIQLEENGDRLNADGVYDPDTKLVHLAKNSLHTGDRFKWTTLHELVHAATTLGVSAEWKPVMGMSELEFSTRQYDLNESLTRILAQAREAAKAQGMTEENWHYGLTNEHEMISEAMTNEFFQKFLNDVKLKGFGSAKPVTLLSRFFGALSKFFGLSNDSALRHVVSLTEEAILLNQHATTDRMAPSDTKLHVQPILVASERAASERRMNRDELRPEEKEELISSEQAQNRWVQLPIFDKLPQYIRDRLPFLDRRLEVHDKSVDANGDRNLTPEAIENSDLPRETKDKLQKDILDNLLDAQNQLDRAKVNNEQDIENSREKVAETLGDSRLVNPERYATESVEGIIQNAQNKLARDLKAGGDADAINARIADLNSIVKEGSTVFNQVFSAIARATPESVLDAADTNTASLLEGVKPTNDGYGRVTYGGMTTTEPTFNSILQTFAADANLAERLKAYRMLINPAEQKALTEGAALMRDAATKNILDTFLSENPQVARNLQFISKGLRSALNLRDVATKTLDAIDSIKKDREWKDLRYQVYKNAGQFAPFFTYSPDQEAVKLTNPITGKEVKLDYSLDGLSSRGNIGKLQELADAAREYVGNKDAEGYNPEVALGWEKFLADADYWLNPNWNPLVPRKVPTRWNFLAWADDLKADANKLLETLSGTVFHDVQVSLNALSDFREEGAKLESKDGHRIDEANLRAAKSHGMSVEQWREEIANKINAYSQFSGQVPLRVGEKVRGNVINASDMEAIKLSKDYEDTLRAKGEATAGIGGAKRINPNRIQTERGFRRSAPSSPYENTRPGRFDYATAKRWWQEWTGLSSEDPTGVEAARKEWLSKPDNLEKILMDHIEWNQTPEYAGKSPFRSTYREIAKEFNAGKSFTFDEIVDRVFDDQIAKEDKDIVLDKDGIAAAITNEIAGLFKRIGSRVSEEDVEKAKDKVSVHSSKNSFTRARSDETQFPPNMMQWGAITYPERVSLMHNALAPYVTEVVGDQGSMDRAGIALDKLSEKYEKRLADMVKGGGTRAQAIKDISNDVKLGNEFYDYAQLQTVINRFKKLRTGTEGTEARQQTDSTLRKWYQRISRTYLAQILASPGARLRHTFGNFVSSAIFFERMDGALGFAGELAKRTGRQIASAIPNIVADIKQTLRPMDIKDMDAANGWFAEKVLERRKDIARLTDQGFIDPANLREKITAFKNAWQDVYKDVDRTKSASQRLGKAGDATLEAFNSLFTNFPVFSARFNDMLLHLDVKNTAIDFERRLQSNALESFGARDKINPEGYKNLDDQINRLSPQELIGKKLVTERNSVEWRKMFEAMGMDLDKRMLDYYERVKQARANGQPIDDIQMLDDGQKAALEWQILQQTGKSSYLNRPFLAKGGLQAQSQWLLYGIPLWSLGRLEGSFARLNYQTKGKYAWQTLPTAIALTAVMAGAGATFDELYRMAKKFFYREQSSNPSALNARNAKDVFHLAVRGWSAFMPIIGDLVNSALNTTSKFGNPDSMFLVWNILSDTEKAMAKVYQTHDPVNPLLEYARRWSPAAHVALAATGYRSGLTNLYNSANIISSATPDTVPVRKRTAGAGASATPVTPVIQDMISAALSGDTAKATQKYQEAVADKVAEGMTEPQAQSAISASYAARNPWILTLGRLPTDSERELILSRMSDDQRAKLLSTEQAMANFGQSISSNVHFTQESGAAGQASASVGVSRGSSVYTGSRIASGGGQSGGTRTGTRSSPIGGSIGEAGPVGVGTGPTGGIRGTSSRSRISRTRIGGRRVSSGRSRIRSGRSRIHLRAPKARISGRSHHRIA